MVRASSGAHSDNDSEKDVAVVAELAGVVAVVAFFASIMTSPSP
jgi:hypothetical protein